MSAHCVQHMCVCVLIYSLPLLTISATAPLAASAVLTSSRPPLNCPVEVRTNITSYFLPSCRNAAEVGLLELEVCALEHAGLPYLFSAQSPPPPLFSATSQQSGSRSPQKSGPLLDADLVGVARPKCRTS